MGGRYISVQLLQLRQGTKSAADYAVKFHALAAQSGWNDATLLAVFREGLVSRGVSDPQGGERGIHATGTDMSIPGGGTALCSPTVMLLLWTIQL